MALFRKLARVSGALVVSAALLGGVSAPAAWAAPPPTIDSFSPTSGPVGTSVTINGSHLNGATSVKFNGKSATFSADSSTKITATVPSGATTGPISVTTPDGTATSSTNFTVTASSAPTISSFSPTSGPVGTSVTINGTNFVNVSSVKFSNNKSATFTVNSSTKITATVPSGATTGPISVTTPGGTATSANNFTVTGTTAPTITSFSPTSGAVGTSVTINGTNFVNVSSVKFSNNKSATFTVNSSTKITTKVPSGATTGPISVTTSAGTATSATNFTVTGVGPNITSFSPTIGRVGTAVTIDGTSFTGATSVKFKGVAASFTVNSATRITATVPPGAATGRIAVTTPAGTDTSDAVFTVVHPRDVTLHLSGHLVATGLITVTDGFGACWRDAPVIIQRWVSGHWRRVARKLTDDAGGYRVRLHDRAGTYRAKARRSVLSGGDVCGRARSNTRRHRH